MKVKILLKDTVDGLGMIGDIVEVAQGYARNYLFPNKLAIEVNSGAINAIEAAKKKRAELEAQRKLSLEELAGKLGGIEITVAEKVSEAGSLYGSVSAAAVAKSLFDMGLEVEEKMIRMPEENIKSLGEYPLTFHLHADIEDPECKLIVVASDVPLSEEEEEEVKAEKRAEKAQAAEGAEEGKGEDEEATEAEEAAEIEED